jgi:hypothetical protein
MGAQAVKEPWIERVSARLKRVWAGVKWAKTWIGQQRLLLMALAVAFGVVMSANLMFAIAGISVEFTLSLGDSEFVKLIGDAAKELC